MYRILVIEDDFSLAQIIKRQIESWGHDVRLITDFQHVIPAFVEYDPHMVLVDVMLPFFNGYHWCREIRRISEVPVMFISSAGDNMNIVMAINMGADDFVAKPFDMDMLLAKIQALLRRTYDFTASRPAVLQHNGVILNSSACSVSFEDRKLELSKNENKILTILMESKGQVVTRDTLMNRLWETDCFVDENTLSVNITRLRKALASIGITDLIKTKKGMGYIIE